MKGYGSPTPPTSSDDDDDDLSILTTETYETCNEYGYATSILMGVSVYHLENNFLKDAWKSTATPSMMTEMMTDLSSLSCASAASSRRQSASTTSGRSSPLNQQQHQLNVTRALRFGQLKGFILSKGRDRICPVDDRMGAAYVQCIATMEEDEDDCSRGSGIRIKDDHVGPAQYMLSFCMEETVGNVISTLTNYCKTNHQDPMRTYVWIDWLCLNLHRQQQHQQEQGGTTTMLGPPKRRKKKKKKKKKKQNRSSNSLKKKTPLFGALPPDLVVSGGGGGGAGRTRKADKSNHNGGNVVDDDDEDTFLSGGGASTHQSDWDNLSHASTCFGNPFANYALDSISLGESSHGGGDKYGIHDDEETITFCGENESVDDDDDDASEEDDGDEEAKEDDENVWEVEEEGADEEEEEQLVFEVSEEEEEELSPFDHSSYGHRVKKIGHLLCIMSPWQKPRYLTKYRRIYELYMAHMNSCAIDILMPPQQEHCLEKDLFLTNTQKRTAQDGLNVLYRVLSKTCVQNSFIRHLGLVDPTTIASGSDQAVALEIYDMIETTIGFTELNNKINQLMRNWVFHVIAKMCQLREFNCNDYESAIFCEKVGCMFWKHALYDQALEQLMMCPAFQEAALGKDHPAIGTTYSNIGSVLYSMGHYDNALQQYEKSLRIFKANAGLPQVNNRRSGGSRSAKRASLYSNIGTVLYAKGNREGSLKLFEKALNILNRKKNSINKSKKKLTKKKKSSKFPSKKKGKAGSRDGDADDPLNKKTELSLATTYSSYVAALISEGDFMGALALYQKPLIQQESLLGKFHPDIAEAYSNIGCGKLSQGDHHGALEMFQKCLKIQVSLLGTNHPQTTETCFNIGAVLKAMGDYTAALELYERSLDVDEDVLGQDHPITAARNSKIGLLLKEKGDYDGALQRYRKCLAIHKRVLGKTHPTTVATYVDIGALLKAKGDHDGAKEYFQKSLGIFSTIWSDDPFYNQLKYKKCKSKKKHKSSENDSSLRSQAHRNPMDELEEETERKQHVPLLDCDAPHPKGPVGLLSNHHPPNSSSTGSPRGQKRRSNCDSSRRQSEQCYSAGLPDRDVLYMSVIRGKRTFKVVQRPD